MKTIKKYIKQICSYFHSHTYVLLDCVIDYEHGKKFNAKCKFCDQKMEVYFNENDECFLIK